MNAYIGAEWHKKRTETLRKLTLEEISARRPHPLVTSDKRFPIAALLDNIRSLYNVGSIFRTSDGAGIRHLYLCGYTPHPPRKEIEKTALGTVATVPWSHHRDPLEAIRAARGAGMRICVLEHTDESIPTYALTPADFPLCLVVGNELTGVAAAIMAEADLAVEIPMHGVKQSLNAAVAYGVAVFDLVRILKGGAGGRTPADATAPRRMRA
ncbi:MAG: RNA methyltransferase [Bacteroidota bacterium]